MDELTVKGIRAATGLSQRKFAERYGIPRRTLEDWESGAHRCPDYVINLLARVAFEDEDE